MKLEELAELKEKTAGVTNASAALTREINRCELVIEVVQGLISLTQEAKDAAVAEILKRIEARATAQDAAAVAAKDILTPKEGEVGEL